MTSDFIVNFQENKKMGKIVQWIPIYQLLEFRLLFYHIRFISVFLYKLSKELQASWHFAQKYFITASPKNKDVIPKVRLCSDITAMPFSYIRKLTQIL